MPDSRPELLGVSRSRSRRLGGFQKGDVELRGGVSRALASLRPWDKAGCCGGHTRNDLTAWRNAVSRNRTTHSKNPTMRAAYQPCTYQPGPSPSAQWLASARRNSDCGSKAHLLRRLLAAPRVREHGQRAISISAGASCTTWSREEGSVQVASKKVEAQPGPRFGCHQRWWARSPRRTTNGGNGGMV